MKRFKDRQMAGELLAERLESFSHLDPIILALPRGGVPVAHEIAKRLKASLDIVLVKKIQAPDNDEFAIGAVAEDENPILNEAYISEENLDRDKIAKTIEKRIAEMKKRALLYREKLPALSLIGRTVIVVDDGLATGSSMIAALKFLQTKKIKRLIVAVPIASNHGAEKVSHLCDEFISLITSANMVAVGYWYENFPQVTDDEVLTYLEKRHEYEKDKPASSKSISQELNEKAVSFNKIGELKEWIDEMAKHHIVMLGEATHGTKEYYQLRREISQILIKDHGFKFIAVEGDWPDCFKINEYVHSEENTNSRDVLHDGFHRWPTWMWANEEMPPLLEWMKLNHLGAFYGLDVYSLFESLDVIKKYLSSIDPKLAKDLKEGYSCFDQYQRNEMKYAESILKMPRGCSEEVVTNLRELLRLRLKETRLNKIELFDIKQNARVIHNAEKYYRTMLGGGAASWNMRDQHMLETLEHLLHLHGPDCKAIVWAHNTHVGDYHATDMLEDGYINLGGIARERFGVDNVYMVGFGSYHGEVTAGKAWGANMQTMELPEAKPGSYEDHFHQWAIQS
ncbi:MAG: erythromycin esterase family protein, partial [Bacteriovorax sp.]